MQPDSPLHGLEGLKHMATAIVPGIYDATLADEDIGVGTEEAFELTRQLAREGVFVGISSGANLAGALAVARRVDNAVIVAANRTLFVQSGYGLMGVPGNVLLAFKPRDAKASAR